MGSKNEELMSFSLFFFPLLKLSRTLQSIFITRTSFTAVAMSLISWSMILHRQLLCGNSCYLGILVTSEFLQVWEWYCPAQTNQITVVNTRSFQLTLVSRSKSSSSICKHQLDIIFPKAQLEDMAAVGSRGATVSAKCTKQTVYKHFCVFVFSRS